MAGAKKQISNFSHLAAHDEQLARLGALAEHYFPEDPNTSLLKLRQFGELMAQDIAARFGEYTSTEEKQVDLLRRLQARRAIPREVGDLFYRIRTAGNDARESSWCPSASNAERAGQGVSRRLRARDEQAGDLLLWRTLARVPSGGRRK